ncbi:MAG: hypothetical protein WC848_05080 [Parcubacteria group bacterium]|jgi:hypothetical protein
MLIKKNIYISFAMLLGMLLVETFQWLIEIWLVDQWLFSGLLPKEYIHLGIHSYLPPYLQIILWACGLFGGYFLGQYWWRIVYVERQHQGMKKNKKH